MSQSIHRDFESVCGSFVPPFAQLNKKSQRVIHVVQTYLFMKNRVYCGDQHLMLLQRVMRR